MRILEEGPTKGDAVAEGCKALLLRMLRREGERAGNKSFLGLMATCLDIAENLNPTRESKVIKAEYLAEELKHAIMFHRLAMGLEHDFVAPRRALRALLVPRSASTFPTNERTASFCETLRVEQRAWQDGSAMRRCGHASNPPSSHID